MPKGKTKFDRCVAGVKRSGSAADPRAVCGAMRAKGTLPRGEHNPRPAYYVVSGGKVIAGPFRTRGRAEHSGYSGDVLTYKQVQQLRGRQRKGWSGWSNPAKAKRNRGRRNPLEAARETYEGFHGRPSEETVEVTTPIHEHTVLAGLGDLVKLVILTDAGTKVVVQKFEDKDGNPAILCRNEKKKKDDRPQLFIEGGDQSVNLAEFAIFEPYHELEILGRCRNVYYYTRKDHLGSDGGTAIYNHKFGGMREVRGRGGKLRRKRSPLPTIVYDTRNRLLSFAGGGYTIPDEGIDN
jgi:hypothetical protein